MQPATPLSNKYKASFLSEFLSDAIGEFFY